MRFEQIIDEDFAGPPATRWPACHEGDAGRQQRSVGVVRHGGPSAMRQCGSKTCRNLVQAPSRFEYWSLAASGWLAVTVVRVPTFTSSSHRGSSMTRKIDWRHIDEKTFNELVETLLVQEETREGRRAMALDGRGGDGGIDVDVRVEQTNQLTHIYQLKYFPGGMSGGHIARRSQVKKSLSAALKSEPSQGWAWTLVLPSKVTAPERKAVRAMRPGSKPEIRFMGPPELDRLLGLHPEIERRFTADYAVEVLREVHRESAALTRPDDLAAEATRLRDRLDGRSVYWGMAFGVEPDGSVRETVFAKRDDAHEREPLSVNLSLQFGPESEAQRKAFADAMNYGVVEEVELTSEVIQAFQTSGP